MAKAKQKITKGDIKKILFWVSCPIAIICGVVVYFYAVDAISADIEKRKQELETKKTSMGRIQSNSTHPNEKTIAEIDEMTSDLRNRVMRAWLTLERDQRKRNQWPAALGADFHRIIEKLKPGDEIPFLMCERYFQFVEKQIPIMLDTVGARKQQYKKYKYKLKDDVPIPELDAKGEHVFEWADVVPNWGIGLPKGDTSSFGGNTAPRSPRGGPSRSDSSGGTGPASGSSPFLDSETRWVGSVDWPNPEIFGLLLEGQIPHYLQVWYAQEDMWVYDAILWVVRQTNLLGEEEFPPGKDTLAKSPIKQIQSIKIGAPAAMAFTAVGISGLSSGGGGGEGEGGGEGGGSAMEGAGIGGLLSASSDALKRTILQFRYVGEDLAPLGADASSFAEFNRMPIVLSLTIDQRRISDVLANCANCAMPIDVLYVAFNLGRGNGVRPLGFSEAAGESGTTGRTGGEYQVSGSVGIYSPEAIQVEIYGIINIFNALDYSELAAVQKAAEEKKKEVAAMNVSPSEVLLEPLTPEETINEEGNRPGPALDENPPTPEGE
ncbi:MAG: hypothetical protein FWC43_08610 [Planctomycetaceae bacterium]|nr:hypothetical protein [Planctomycetaceae bacterium]